MQLVKQGALLEARVVEFLQIMTSFYHHATATCISIKNEGWMKTLKQSPLFRADKPNEAKTIEYLVANYF